MRVFRGTRIMGHSPIALTIGNFDGVHLGHQAMLQRLREAALVHGLPSAVLTFEPHPREFFSPADAPARLTSLREKLELFRAHGIDQVHVARFDRAYASMSPQQFIDDLLVKNLKIRWLLIGDDFRYGAQRGGDFALLKQAATHLGFALESMGSIEIAGERVSSTGVRDALAAADFARAARLLGRPYCISGRVAHGKKLGRELGFPTANIALKRKRAPLNGIYAVKLYGIGAKPLPAVASLGVRPTVLDGAAPLLEIHVLDFNQDIYGRRVSVAFLHKLRDEEKYPDIESLRRQIAIDVENARTYLNSNL
jgi:riboflavin kinase / FMN adenylyltransferase